jgi:hypothetical protein
LKAFTVVIGSSRFWSWGGIRLTNLYQHRRWSFQGSSKKVNNEIECWYCYLERQESDTDVGILVKNIDTNKMFDRNPEDWR